MESHSDYNFPFSLDVVSLYTSIPPTEALEALETTMSENKSLMQTTLKISQILRILSVILENTYFNYRGHTFRQISGLPMGNNVSGILAIIYMGRLETNIIRSDLQVKLYRRYVDDYFFLTTNEEEARKIFNFMNGLKENIKFEMELSKDGSLSLLDFTVRFNNGSKEFTFYKKPEKKDIWPHYDSAIPMASKRAFARNEINRINERCSTKGGKTHEVGKFYEILNSNGYPKCFINDLTNKKKLKKKPMKSRDESRVFFKFPFINEKVNSMVNGIFRSAELPVRTYSKSITLRSLLRRRRHEPQPCNLEHCKIKDSNLCFRKNCVYECICKKCGKSYIGSTIRPLHIRVREHLRDENSSVFKHHQICKAEFQVRIELIDNDVINLRLKEALLIRRKQPPMNNRVELSDLTAFINF